MYLICTKKKIFDKIGCKNDILIIDTLAGHRLLLLMVYTRFKVGIQPPFIKIYLTDLLYSSILPKILP